MLSVVQSTKSVRNYEHSQHVPVKVGVDSSGIGSIAGDTHAAALVGHVERHVDGVEESIPNGEHHLQH